nr:enzymatic polyprotein [Tanacetum cinerariifolium]
MKNILTTKENEEMKKPTAKKFRRFWDSLINYNEVHTTMLFYPKNRRVGPPEASPMDVYDNFVHGLIDTLYIDGDNLRELQEFPPKAQGIIKGYNDLFAKG